MGFSVCVLLYCFECFFTVVFSVCIHRWRPFGCVSNSGVVGVYLTVVVCCLSIGGALGVHPTLVFFRYVIHGLGWYLTGVFLVLYLTMVFWVYI